VLTTVANPVLCIGLPDTLSATAPGAQVTWLGYDPGDSIIVSPATTTTYVAVAENAANCTDTAIITVQVIDFKISLTASPDPIVAGFPVSLVATSSMPYQAISWEPSGQFPDQTASTQTFTIIDTSQTFSVTGINDNGCLDTASITVVVQPNLGDFFIPNAFTPNGDGRNDVFMVYGSSIRDIDIRIFNQWGQLVFESQDAQRGWDGSYGGHQQPAGVYLYVIKVDLYGQPRTIYKKGSLNLIR
jgi:gliding motility-associated-like protein